MNAEPGKIRCDACPVLCYIREGLLGACDRYANLGGVLTRVDPHVLLDRTLQGGGEVVSFLGRSRDCGGAARSEHCAGLANLWGQQDLLSLQPKACR